MGAPDASIDGVSEQALRRLHSDVGAVVALLIDNEGLMPTVTIEKRLLPLPQRTAKRRAKKKPILLVTGAVRDVCLELLYHLLVTVPTERIRRRPGCTVAFVRVGRQTYCAPKCYDDHHRWADFPPARIEQYRRSQYKKSGWKRGARRRPAAT